MARRIRSQRGYSLVEVMMALAVLTAGSLGVMSLQRASMHSNVEAREMSTASSIARLWLERLKRDSRVWNEGANLANPALLAQTDYLRSFTISAPNTPDAAWENPTLAAPPGGGINVGESSAFDHYGNEIFPTNDPAVRYCAQARLQWVTPGQTIRSEVRVYWARLGDAPVRCDIFDASVEAPGSGFHVVRATTVLRWTPR